MTYRAADGASHSAPLGFVLSPRTLLTVRFADLPVFDSFAERFAGAAHPSSVRRIPRPARGDRRPPGGRARACRRGPRGDLAPDVPRRGRAREERQQDRRAAARDAAGGGRAPGRGCPTCATAWSACSGSRSTCTTWPRSWIPADTLHRFRTMRQDIASLTDYDVQLDQQGAVPAGCDAGVHQHRAEQRHQGADRGLGGRRAADADGQHLRHELQVDSRAAMGLRIFVRFER